MTSDTFEIIRDVFQRECQKITPMEERLDDRARRSDMEREGGAESREKAEKPSAQQPGDRSIHAKPEYSLYLRVQVSCRCQEGNPTPPEDDPRSSVSDFMEFSSGNKEFYF